MKKIIIFLIAIISIIIPYKVMAKETTFYEGAHLSEIFLKRVTNQKTYYQTGIMYREVGTRRIAYCIEPFIVFHDTEKYTDTENPPNLTKEQIERISLIAHYGYNYNGNYNVSWYASTQILIWRTVDPQAEFYHTDTLNGNRTNKYDYQIDSIEKNIKNYQTNPSFTNNNYNIVYGQNLSLTDTNNVLSHYTTDNENVTIKNNNLTVENLSVGEHTITLTREEKDFNDPVLFYTSNNSQDFVTIGDLSPKKVELKITVQETNTKINKLDSDTKDKESSINAKLEGSQYKIYDDKMNELFIIEIDDNHTANIKNLNYGKYYLKECKAGIGYTVDDTIYEFELTKDNPNIELNLYNKIIKANVKINKSYLNDEKLEPEKYIAFNIYNENKELVKTVVTDEFGKIELNLPYGIYTIEQVSTTPGYTIIEPFNIIINNDTELTFNLINYKIEVPDTRAYTPSIIIKLLRVIFQILKYV